MAKLFLELKFDAASKFSKDMCLKHLVLSGSRIFHIALQGDVWECGAVPHFPGWLEQPREATNAI